MHGTFAVFQSIFTYVCTSDSFAAPWADQAEDVLDYHVPDKLDSHLDEDQVDDDHLQPGGVSVGALRAQDVEQLPEYALEARGEQSRKKRADRGGG